MFNFEIIKLLMYKVCHKIEFENFLVFVHRNYEIESIFKFLQTLIRRLDCVSYRCDGFIVKVTTGCI